jgi:Ankyrin repeats (3 copies)/Ankyrin repeats (many copies)
MSNVHDSTTVDEAKALVLLCRSGRLYEIEKWIAAGKPLDVSAAVKRSRQKTLLEIAVETGFYSLVELIAKHEADQTSKNAALYQAVSSRRLDLVSVLLSSGADIKSVPLTNVLLGWEPLMIRFFLDHGSDPIEGRPFAVALGARVRTALRAFIECKQSHPELAPQLQEQLDCALRHSCGEGDLKWVSLLTWAGGDPRSRGPCLGKDYTECHTSGLEEACHSGNLEVLKKLKPDPHRDNLPNLLDRAAVSNREAVLQYLLQLGANPNDKPGGGSKALETALWHLGFARCDFNGSGRLRAKYDLSDAFGCIRVLLAYGAVWNPDDSYHVSSLRRNLLGCESNVTLELLQLFRKYNACPAERVHNLLGSPRIKEHLRPVVTAISRLGIDLNAKPTRRTRPHPSPRPIKSQDDF